MLASIAWSQYRPVDGPRFREQRNKVERRGSRSLPRVADSASPTGLRKIAYQLNRPLVPRKPLLLTEVASKLAS
jgi:hypothetical protein